MTTNRDITDIIEDDSISKIHNKGFSKWMITGRNWVKGQGIRKTSYWIGDRVGGKQTLEKIFEGYDCTEFSKKAKTAEENFYAITTLALLKSDLQEQEAEKAGKKAYVITIQNSILGIAIAYYGVAMGLDHGLEKAGTFLFESIPFLNAFTDNVADGTAIYLIGGNTIRAGLAYKNKKGYGGLGLESAVLNGTDYAIKFNNFRKKVSTKLEPQRRFIYRIAAASAKTPLSL